MRISGVQTLSQWAVNNKIPVRFIFGGISETEDILKAIEQPETFAASKLASLLDVIKELRASGIIECQNAFIAETVPPKYAKLGITLAPLLEHLRGKHGTHPNNWPRSPDISDFIRGQYKSTFAPRIAERIRSKPAEELKHKLLELAQEDEELGLLFWEV